jgi:hypothetical protein
MIFSLPVLMLLVLTELSLRIIPNDYSFKRDYLDKYSNKISVLFLGNSHVYFGIKPELLEAKSFNAAHISQSLDYDFEILKKYENNWSNLKYIILPVDYFSLYGSLTDGSEEWRVKNYKIYYGVSTRDKFNDNFELLNGKFGKNINRAFKYWTKNRNDLACDKLGWGTSYNSANNQDLLETGKSAALRHTSAKGVVLPVQVSALNKILSFAKTKNIKVILFISPAYKTYVENLKPQQLAKTIGVLNQLKEQNKGLEYYNFINDKSFVAKDFYDGDHLNEIGAKKFSLKMDSIVKFQNKALTMKAGKE